MSPTEGKNVLVVGIGAMGGGMARALLNSPVAKSVTGYDKFMTAVEAFFQESKVVEKAHSTPPTSLVDAVNNETDFAILSLVNESQCEQVCFGDGDNLLTLMPKGSCVILTSTVTATWARKAAEKFKGADIHFIDCPVSGGPARARTGELTLMASGESESLQKAKSILDAMGKEVYIVEGGAGAGSTVKCVHQLLAGVHICAAAEALAMAAKAGLDVDQMYQIVNGAAGASWMFTDRGKRMLMTEADVKSALDIFVKDLGIVYAEAKEMKSPIPVASAALQQFICGQGLGLGKQDDSQVVKVYETFTGVPVANSKSAEKETTSVNDSSAWGSIVDASDEPQHSLILSTEHARVFKTLVPPKETTLCFVHSAECLHFYLSTGGVDVIRHFQGSEPIPECKNIGEIQYDAVENDEPQQAQKLTNNSNEELFMVDVEVLKQSPIKVAMPLDVEKHELITTTKSCRVYKLTLNPGEKVTATYSFFYISLVLTSSEIETKTCGDNAPGLSWKKLSTKGDIQWNQPTFGVTLTNVGSSVYEQFIIEWK